MKKLTIGAVDLFCGAGGLTRGLLNAGIDVRLGFDVDGDCKHAYEANNGSAKFVLANLAKVLPSDVIKGWKGADVRLLAGCAPCQAFSSYTQGKDWNRKDQWSLLRAFSRFVERCEPDIVTMENVASLGEREPQIRFNGRFSPRSDQPKAFVCVSAVRARPDMAEARPN